jgi:hypothetical protein
LIEIKTGVGAGRDNLIAEVRIWLVHGRAAGNELGMEQRKARWTELGDDAGRRRGLWLPAAVERRGHGQ